MLEPACPPRDCPPAHPPRDSRRMGYLSVLLHYVMRVRDKEAVASIRVTYTTFRTYP